MNQALPKWEIQGELILNCNCTVFCPCVVSLGVHYPTEGHCQAWLGVHIGKAFMTMFHLIHSMSEWFLISLVECREAIGR